jgi:acyl carrier protein
MEKNPSVIKERVRTYIKQSVHAESDKIADDTLIFKEGFLDSMGLIALIAFLEEGFAIRTDDSDLIEDNFESINAITDFVVKKSGI